LFEFFRRSFGIELFALIDERINDVSLAAGGQLLPQECNRFAQFIGGEKMRDNFARPRGISSMVETSRSP
jgi:hypothetical protein